jgi:hypothetical protein
LQVESAFALAQEILLKMRDFYDLHCEVAKLISGDVSSFNLTALQRKQHKLSQSKGKMLTTEAPVGQRAASMRWARTAAIQGLLLS